MSLRALGLDTSNYTTSAAVFDGARGFNAGRLLDVRPGELGLRQSDALFQHVKHLPGRFAALRGRGVCGSMGAMCRDGHCPPVKRYIYLSQAGSCQTGQRVLQWHRI